VRNSVRFVQTATVNRCQDLVRRQTSERNIMNRFRSTPEYRAKAETVASDLQDVLFGLGQRKRAVVVLLDYLS
jgi:DNA-directed RNA polymerase specialized sigma24 family protein